MGNFYCLPAFDFPAIFHHDGTCNLSHDLQLAQPTIAIKLDLQQALLNFTWLCTGPDSGTSSTKHPSATHLLPSHGEAQSKGQASEGDSQDCYQSSSR